MWLLRKFCCRICASRSPFGKSLWPKEFSVIHEYALGVAAHIICARRPLVARYLCMQHFEVHSERIFICRINAF